MMLTGRTRYRIGWRKKLVMQVEAWMLVPRGGWSLPGHELRWRDATIEDMQAIKRGDVKTDRPGYPLPPPLASRQADLERMRKDLAAERPACLKSGTNPPPAYDRPPPPPPPPPSLKPREVVSGRVR